MYQVKVNCINLKSNYFVTMIEFVDGYRFTSKDFKALINEMFYEACTQGVDADNLVAYVYYSTDGFDTEKDVFKITAKTYNNLCGVIDTYFYINDVLYRVMNIAN